MKSLYIEEAFPYDGTQLRSLYAYLNYKVLGPSIISWQGACHIEPENIVDGEDLLANAEIAGSKMLHFIAEIFDRDLFSAVALQRMFAAIARDYLQENSSVLQKNKTLIRDGDDLYLDDKKLSISIATKSPVSVMIHFAMNISNEGTPVKTLSLEDLNLEAKKVSEDLMKKFITEFESIQKATQKVRPIQ